MEELESRDQTKNPEYDASYFSLFTFDYMKRLFHMCNANVVHGKDLPPVLDSVSTQNSYDRLWNGLRRSRFLTFGKLPMNPQNKSHEGLRMNIYRAIPFDLAIPVYFAGMLTLVATLFQVRLPRTPSPSFCQPISSSTTL